MAGEEYPPEEQNTLGRDEEAYDARHVVGREIFVPDERNQLWRDPNMSEAELALHRHVIPLIDCDKAQACYRQVQAGSSSLGWLLMLLSHVISRGHEHATSCPALSTQAAAEIAACTKKFN